MTTLRDSSGNSAQPRFATPATGRPNLAGGIGKTAELLGYRTVLGPGLMPWQHQVNGTATEQTPEGRFAYVHTYNGNVVVMSRDTTTGALSELDDQSACFSHDGSAGTCTDANATGSDSDSGHELAIVGSHVYTAGRDSGTVDRFDRSTVTGALTEADCWSADGNDADGNATCTPIASLVGAQSLAVSPDGKFLYVGSYEPDGPYGLSVLSISVMIERLITSLGSPS